MSLLVTSSKEKKRARIKLMSVQRYTVSQSVFVGKKWGRVLEVHIHGNFGLSLQRCIAENLVVHTDVGFLIIKKIGCGM